METFSINGLIEQKVQEFVKQHGKDVSKMLIIEGLNFGDYFVLRKINGKYNFVSLNVNYKAHLDEDCDTFEDCVKHVIREGKEIFIFDDLNEFCAWYLTDAKRCFSKYNYNVVVEPKK